jgi:hypothetical protein
VRQCPIGVLIAMEEKQNMFKGTFEIKNSMKIYHNKNSFVPKIAVNDGKIS